MDGRDAFLTMAREKHYEFSSLRRAKFSTMSMLYELHNQGQDKFVYTCNNCKAHVETRYHCTVCDDFDLCIQCYDKDGHPHKMEKLGLDLDDGSSPSDPKQANPQEARKLSIQRCIQSLVSGKFFNLKPKSTKFYLEKHFETSTFFLVILKNVVFKDKTEYLCNF